MNEETRCPSIMPALNSPELEVIAEGDMPPLFTDEEVESWLEPVPYTREEIIEAYEPPPFHFEYGWCGVAQEYYEHYLEKLEADCFLFKLKEMKHFIDKTRDKG